MPCVLLAPPSTNKIHSSFVHFHVKKVLQLCFYSLWSVYNCVDSYSEWTTVKNFKTFETLREQIFLAVFLFFFCYSSISKTGNWNLFFLVFKGWTYLLYYFKLFIIDVNRFYTRLNARKYQFVYWSLVIILLLGC